MTHKEACGPYTILGLFDVECIAHVDGSSGPSSSHSIEGGLNNAARPF